MTAAAGVLQMPANESASNREAEERDIASRKEEAKHHYEHIVRAAALQSRNSLRIGFHAFALKEKSLWGLLGYRDEHETREAAGVGESTWFSTIRLAEQFRTVPEELFIAMRLTNAKALADLPESKRQDREWLKYAADESLKDFAKRCEEEMNGKAKDSDTKEPVTAFKATMPVSQKKAVDEGIKTYAATVGIDPANTGKVLEAAMAELNGGETLIGAMTTAVQSLKEAKKIAESGLSAAEALEKVLEINDGIILKFGEALAQASQRNSEAA